MPHARVFMFMLEKIEEKVIKKPVNKLESVQ